MSPYHGNKGISIALKKRGKKAFLWFLSLWKSICMTAGNRKKLLISDDSKNNPLKDFSKNLKQPCSSHHTGENVLLVFSLKDFSVKMTFGRRELQTQMHCLSEYVSSIVNFTVSLKMWSCKKHQMAQRCKRIKKAKKVLSECSADTVTWSGLRW